MELPTWAAYLAAGLLTVLFLKAVLRRGSGRRTYNLPPGPKPWPVIGNLNLMGPLPHRSIHELSKRHGPLMQLRFGSMAVVIGSSAGVARLFLKTHDAAIADRPRFAIGRHTAYDCTDILWSNYGAYLRQARRICAAELFSAKRLESFEHIRDEEVRATLRGLRRASSSSGQATVRLRDHLNMLTLGVISRMVLGKKYVGEEEEEKAAEGCFSPPAATPAEFREMVDEFFVLNGAFNIGDFLPWLDWMDLQGYVRRMKKTAHMFGRFLDRILEEHNERRRREGEGFVARDMVDVLLQLADDPNLEVPLTRDNVKAITQDLVIGGTDTSSMTMEWAISELLKNPKCLVMASEELDRVVGRDRLVSERDLPHLPYIEAILKETMRVHPAAPVLAPHVAHEDVSMGGYDIPAGTTVFINVWSIGRDPVAWDAPDEFHPEWFMVNKVDVRGHDFELLPFGSGRRMCPGYSLALKVMLLSIANLVHAFEWRLPDGTTEEELDMEEVFLLAMPRKVPLEVVLQPKLPAHLYAGV
ncbi:hypothetical protein ACP70R_009158 [Stipagrostis hirtigluma subsp. patula]